jgi:precorrin-3B synthase
MPTGDGLLVRLQPIGTVPLAAFAALCAAARKRGNGVIEVTSRGNIQIRGLTGSSAPRFAAEVAALGIAADDGVPAYCNALAGIGADEVFDAEALAAELRDALAQQSLAARLSPKVSVAVDGGGTPDLARLAADVRLCAQAVSGEVTLRVAVGGDGNNAIDLGTIDPADGVGAAVRLLEVVARHGRQRRARDIVAAEGEAVFRAALAGLLLPGPDAGWNSFGQPKAATQRDVIGNHPLSDGSVACGVGLAFGHADATIFERLTDAARDAGVSGFRAAPGRAFLAVGLPVQTATAFAAAAAGLGFITQADDPRGRVVACAGAPICGSAHIASRAIAPLVAALPEGSVHISGCAKGCAQAGPAALTVVGTAAGCALVANGTTRDAPFATVSVAELPAAIAAFAKVHEDGHV